jgi:hypothetical protein
LLGGDKSLLLELKSKYVLSFVAALLACKGSKALVYTSAEVLATGGSLALLVSMSSASSNARVATVLGSGRLVVISSSSYKN